MKIEGLCLTILQTGNLIDGRHLRSNHAKPGVLENGSRWIARNQSRIFTELMIQSDVNQFIGDATFQAAMQAEQDAAEHLNGVRMKRARLTTTASDGERAILDAQVIAAMAVYKRSAKTSTLIIHGFRTFSHHGPLPSKRRRD